MQYKVLREFGTNVLSSRCDYMTKFPVYYCEELYFMLLRQSAVRRAVPVFRGRGWHS
jgi:hypothetical protein